LEYEPTNTSWTTVRALLGDLCASLLTSVVYSFAFHKSERKPSVSTEGPPPTRGSHKRLNSIDDDDWEERPESLHTVPYGSKQNSADPSDQLTVSSDVNSSEDNDVDSLDSPRFYGDGSRRGYDGGAEPNERSNLLPPPGLNTSEYYDKSNASESRAGLSSESSQRRQSRRTNWPNEFQSASTERRGNTTGAKEMEYLVRLGLVCLP
jgi:hypothetical protein